MAGIMRLQYPATLRPLRVPCTGRVSADLIVKLLWRGADGVMVVG
ncbi:MAG: hydrogenase iron-sulfur subunit [Candidatus Freyarchaeota archaeon]|nr:hydrogenase iron-sulfur subunit [Candidatus Jordarchaeia archaeon]